jgi:hypothetical protein
MEDERCELFGTRTKSEATGTGVEESRIQGVEGRKDRGLRREDGGGRRIMQ